MKAHKNSLLLAAIVVATASIVVPFGSAVPIMAAEAGSIVVAGRVTSAEKPVSGAPVVVVAWPSQDVLSQQKPGDEGRLIPIAEGKTDEFGAFTLRDESSIDLTGFTSKGQSTINLSVYAFEGESIASYAFSREVDPVTGRLGTASETGKALEATAGDISLGIDRRAGTSATEQEMTVASELSKATIPFNYKLVQYYSPAWALVGQLYISTTGVSGLFTYQNGASSSLGVGVSATGGFGSFSSSGTSSQSSSASITFPTVTSNQGRYFDTQFVHGLYEVHPCAPTSCPAILNYETRVSSFAGGSQVRSASAPTANLCVSFAAGSSFTKNTSTAVAWSNGLSMAPAIGLNLSSQTGYSTSASVAFSFSSARRLCGTNDYPGGTPRQLVAKA